MFELSDKPAWQLKHDRTPKTFKSCCTTPSSDVCFYHSSCWTHESVIPLVMNVGNVQQEPSACIIEGNAIWQQWSCWLSAQRLGLSSRFRSNANLTHAALHLKPRKLNWCCRNDAESAGKVLGIHKLWRLRTLIWIKSYDGDRSECRKLKIPAFEFQTLILKLFLFFCVLTVMLFFFPHSCSSFCETERGRLVILLN